jgi:hypothetical protein
MSIIDNTLGSISNPLEYKDLLSHPFYITYTDICDECYIEEKFVIQQNDILSSKKSNNLSKSKKSDGDSIKSLLFNKIRNKLYHRLLEDNI